MNGADILAAIFFAAALLVVALGVVGPPRYRCACGTEYTDHAALCECEDEHAGVEA